MNHRMAAAVKNSEPMILLSWALKGKTWDSKLPISLGKSQQTVPATTKTMARILIAISFATRGKQKPRSTRGAAAEL
jgi:hypothetical protein